MRTKSTNWLLYAAAGLFAIFALRVAVAIPQLIQPYMGG